MVYDDALEIFRAEGIDTTHLEIVESDLPENSRRWRFTFSEPDREPVEERVLLLDAEFPPDELTEILKSYFKRAAVRLTAKIEGRNF